MLWPQFTKTPQTLREPISGGWKEALDVVNAATLYTVFVRLIGESSNDLTLPITLFVLGTFFQC